jgi:protein-tyrosine-phosphatase/predicted ATP-grasp superfamily ATP-dependent carboligase
LVAVPSGQTLRVKSKAISGIVQLEGSVIDSARLLRMFVQAEQVDWLVPSSDSALSVLIEGYEDLSSLCVVGCPHPGVVRRVLDKSSTLDVAARCGVPVPTSVTIPDETELERVLPALGFPIVAKPADKEQPGIHSFKTRTFETAREIRAAFASQPTFGKGLLFQTYHGGQGVGVELLMHRGKPIAAFQHRRLLENPPSGGVAVIAISEALNKTLLDHSVRLLNALGWSGVAMVEFRHDSTTNETALMEVNGRFWGSLPLAIAAGVDFPRYAFEIARGVRPKVSAAYRLGLRVRWTAGALKRLETAFSDGEGFSKTRAFVQFIAGFRPGTRSATWAWSDPTPAVQEVSNVLAGWLKRLIKSVAKMFVPAQLLSIGKSALTLPGDRRGIYLKRRFVRVAGLERQVVLPSVVNSVLFVCHGNIMRSASAAQFLRDDLAAAGVVGVRVASAGTHARNGREADSRVKLAASELGAVLEDHRATLLTADLVASNDVIFAMDEFNFANILSTFPESREKLLLFGGMTPSGTYQAHEIADPYMTGQAEVASTIAVVRSYVAALAIAIRQRRDAMALIAATAARRKIS